MPHGESRGVGAARMTEARIAPDNPSHWERPLRARLMEADESALAEIYDKYASFVFGLALRVIGDRTAAEDVSQDVFMSIWESPSSFDPDRCSVRTHSMRVSPKNCRRSTPRWRRTPSSVETQTSCARPPLASEPTPQPNRRRAYAHECSAPRGSVGRANRCSSCTRR